MNMPKASYIMKWIGDAWKKRTVKSKEIRE